MRASRERIWAPTAKDAGVVLTRQAVVDVPTGVIAVVALAVLWRFKVKEPYIVLAGAIAGLLLH